MEKEILVRMLSVGDSIVYYRLYGSSTIRHPLYGRVSEVHDNYIIFKGVHNGHFKCMKEDIRIRYYSYEYYTLKFRIISV